MEEKMLEEVFKKQDRQFFASIEVFREIAETQG